MFTAGLKILCYGETPEFATGRAFHDDVKEKKERGCTRRGSERRLPYRRAVEKETDLLGAAFGGVWMAFTTRHRSSFWSDNGGV
jgi:hypothetical protein